MIYNLDLGHTAKPKHEFTINQGRRRRGAGGQGAGGQRALPLSKVGGGGGTSGFVPPPPLLDRANVLISLFAHILWLKTLFFSKFSWLASLANFKSLINQYFLNFANLKL